MAKRERVQLAHKYDSKKHFISGWYMSEKLDGMRCYWDGGITRGMVKSDVPWANCLKDDRLVNVEISTGLWSRLGNVVHAPDWWINALPKCPVDGELYIDRLTHRQDLMSRIKKLVPNDKDWLPVFLKSYGLPSYEKMFPLYWNFVKQCLFDKGLDTQYRPPNTLTFRQEYFLLKVHCAGTPVEQHELPLSGKLAPIKLKEFADHVIALGAEGVMLRDPNKEYECCRSWNLLKHKPFDDMEGTITGFITGRETDKGSKLLGLMGAMILRLDDGNRLELSGFTNAERKLEGFHHGSATRAQFWAEDNPETECPGWIDCVHFKRGDRVTFKYRGLTKAGVPSEARYYRKDERL